MAALELADVRKVYGSGENETVALDHADLTVGDTEIVTLLGPSGSGKTTLLSIAGGLLSPTSGSVRVGGHDIEGYSTRQLTAYRREEVGFVIQQVNLETILTARQNLLNDAELAHDTKQATQHADRLIEELGLAHRRNALPGTMSGGERQRVAVGRALMNSPKLVLVDEPTSALDSKLGAQVMDLIVGEVRNRGTAAVIVTHDRRITSYADRTVEITDGRLAAGAVPA